MKLLREMQADDIDAVVAIIDTHDDDDAEEAERDYHEVGGFYDQFVLEQEGKVIGVTGFKTPPGCEQTHWLSWTYIHEDYTNQGLGRKMLTELIEHLKEQGARKLFIKVSDYVSDEGEALYAAALHLYQKLGFVIEITHEDFYDEGESQMILGMRLKPINDQAVVIEEQLPIQFNAIYEIAETEDAYSFGWHDQGDALFSVADVEVGLESAKEEEARAVFLTFPSNYFGIGDTLLRAGFQRAGRLDDYYEDGIHEDHYSYRF